MTIQIDDKTFDNFASAVEHVKKTKPRIKDAEAYVSSIEQRVASINCPKTNLAKLKQRLAENVVIKRKSNFDKITGKLIPHDITDGDGTQSMVTSPKKGNKVVSTGGNKQLERIKKLQLNAGRFDPPTPSPHYNSDNDEDDLAESNKIHYNDGEKDRIKKLDKYINNSPNKKGRRVNEQQYNKYVVDNEGTANREYTRNNKPINPSDYPQGKKITPQLKRQFAKLQQRLAGLNKKKIFPQEDLEIAIKDLDVITDPTEYREQEKYIKRLQNPKENLDKIKRRMAKLKQRLAVQGHFYGKDTDEVNHGDIITVKKGNNNINHYYKGNKKIFSDFWSDVKEGDSFKVNKDSVEGHDRVKLQKNARFDLINRRMYEAKEHKHYIQFKQAKRIGEVGEFKGATQEKYWKYWLLNAKQTNGNGWGVSNESIHANINKFIGRPFCVTAKQWFPESEYETYEHPYLPTNNLDTIFNHQAKYAAGDIVDIIREKDDYYAMIKPKAQFANQSPPAFCSPAIFQLDPHEPENKISKWEALHLAGLDRDPAYGAQIALLKGTCIGTKNECKVQFHVAKLNQKLQKNAGIADDIKKDGIDEYEHTKRLNRLLKYKPKEDNIKEKIEEHKYLEHGIKIRPDNKTREILRGDINDIDSERNKRTDKIINYMNKLNKDELEAPLTHEEHSHMQKFILDGNPLPIDYLKIKKKLAKLKQRLATLENSDSEMSERRKRIQETQPHIGAGEPYKRKGRVIERFPASVYHYNSYPVEPTKSGTMEEVYVDKHYNKILKPRMQEKDRRRGTLFDNEGGLQDREFAADALDDLSILDPNKWSGEDLKELEEELTPQSKTNYTNKQPIRDKIHQEQSGSVAMSDPFYNFMERQISEEGKYIRFPNYKINPIKPTRMEWRAIISAKLKQRLAVKNRKFTDLKFRISQLQKLGIQNVSEPFKFAPPDEPYVLHPKSKEIESYGLKTVGASPVIKGTHFLTTDGKLIGAGRQEHRSMAAQIMRGFPDKTMNDKVAEADGATFSRWGTDGRNMQYLLQQTGMARISADKTGINIDTSHPLTKNQHSIIKQHLDDNNIVPDNVFIDDYTNTQSIKKQLRLSKLQQKIAEYKLNSPEPVTINPQHGKIIADAYESMKHDPNHPAVKEAYGALIKETNNQFKELTNNGLKITKSNENIYKTSKDMHDDIEKNNHLYYFPTEAGFGQDKSNTDHPMLQSTEFKQEGNNLLANDVFRIVHDINGHHLGGKTSFGPKGEHQAYLQHSKMYSPLAKKALFTETAGQNNWVNFGPQGAHNRANPKETIYGQQKAGLLPDNIINGKHHQ